MATYDVGVDELNRRYGRTFYVDPVTAAPGESLTVADQQRYRVFAARDVRPRTNCAPTWTRPPRQHGPAPGPPSVRFPAAATPSRLGDVRDRRQRRQGRAVGRATRPRHISSAPARCRSADCAHDVGACRRASSTTDPGSTSNDPASIARECGGGCCPTRRDRASSLPRRSGRSARPQAPIRARRSGRNRQIARQRNIADADATPGQPRSRTSGGVRPQKSWRSTTMTRRASLVCASARS